MKYSNFRDFIKHPDSPVSFAVVDRHSWLPFVKPKTVQMFSEGTGAWRSMETGRYMPDDVDRLEKAFKAQQHLAQIYADKP